MACLADVNLLLACCYQGHAHHVAALHWLDEQEASDVVICHQTQLGLLRLLTNASLMGKSVCTLSQAWDVYDLMMSDERFDFQAESPGLEGALRENTQSGRVSPKLWQDAYLAAFARTAKLRLATFDRGFKQFSALKVELLSGIE